MTTNKEANNEEFYHQDLFGVVDVDLGAEEEGPEVGKKSSSDFNVFSITEALAQRDKRNGWKLYQQAMAAGLSAEEIFWKLVWQVKSLLLASRTKSAEEAGMKSFPYNKAKSALKNWKEGELEDLSEKLVIGYHKCRLGEEEMETFVEKILLSL